MRNDWEKKVKEEIKKAGGIDNYFKENKQDEIVLKLQRTKGWDKLSPEYKEKHFLFNLHTKLYYKEVVRSCEKDPIIPLQGTKD